MVVLKLKTVAINNFVRNNPLSNPLFNFALTGVHEHRWTCIFELYKFGK